MIIFVIDVIVVPYEAILARRRMKIKVFVGSRGGFFKKSPWPPEAKK
jgi:hypothetical protein